MYVQDNTYLVMLVVIMAALFLARAGREACHALMAVAIIMKLSPLYYVKNVLTMRRRTAVVFVAILLAGLVLPYFVWDNYLYIYRYGNDLKGDWASAAASLALRGAVLRSSSGTWRCGSTSTRRTASGGAWCRSRCCSASR